MEKSRSSFYQSVQKMPSLLSQQDQDEFQKLRLKFKVQEFKFMMILMQAISLVVMIFRNVNYECRQKLPYSCRFFNLLIIIAVAEFFKRIDYKNKERLNAAVIFTNIVVTVFLVEIAFDFQKFFPESMNLSNRLYMAEL